MSKLETNSRLVGNDFKADKFVEVLGDTVSPVHIISAVIISLVLSFGGNYLGEKILPGLVSERLVGSYALLMGIIGSVFALIINSKLFPPKRILTEIEYSKDEQYQVLEELKIDFNEERRILENDPVTTKELKDLDMLDIFIEERSVKK